MRRRSSLALLALLSQRRRDLVGKQRSHFSRRNTHGAQSAAAGSERLDAQPLNDTPTEGLP